MFLGADETISSVFPPAHALLTHLVPVRLKALELPLWTFIVVAHPEEGLGGFGHLGLPRYNCITVSGRLCVFR